MSRSDIRGVVDALGGLMKVLRSADAADVAEVYRQLGLKSANHHETQKRRRPDPGQRRQKILVSEGGLDHYAYALGRSQSLLLG